MSADVKPFQGQQPVYTIPETTLGELASRVRSGLHGNAFRVVGDPAAKVSRIAMGVGSGMPRFSKDVDVVIGGEAAEVGGADNTGYALDATSLGMARGFIILGHVVSEEPRHGIRRHLAQNVSAGSADSVHSGARTFLESALRRRQDFHVGAFLRAVACSSQLQHLLHDQARTSVRVLFHPDRIVE